MRGHGLYARIFTHVPLTRMTCTKGTEVNTYTREGIRMGLGDTGSLAYPAYHGQLRRATLLTYRGIMM
jgi:hypothetical protein